MGDVPWNKGFIASYTAPDGRRGAILDLRCESQEVAESAEFRELALEICRQVARYSPRYLRLSEVPDEEAEALLERWRVEALRRGIPDEDLQSYAVSKAREQIRQLCLLELPLGEHTVGEALESLGRRVGQTLEVRRYYRLSMED